MAIGYINISPIQQGNQQVVNSMAGLGQQISSAIETHAATESAKAMLPMLQQQYQAGMKRISDGDPNGLADIYNASMTASQNPLLAEPAQKALGIAQSANINVQHMRRTQAAQQGRILGLLAKYPGFIDPNTGAVNPNWKGSPTKGSVMNPSQQANLVTKYRGATQSLWSGGDGVEGAGSYVADFLNPTGDKEKADKFVAAIQQYNTYKQDLADQGIQFSDPNFENAIAQLGKTTFGLQQQLENNPKGMVGQWDIPFLGKRGGHPISEEFNTMEKRFNKVAPSTIKAAQTSANKEDYLINKAKQAIKNGKDPKAVQQKLDELLKQMRNPSQATNPPAAQMNPSTSMLPAATGTGGMAQGTLDEEDDAMEDEDEVDAITKA
jgi:hypothetical protein